ncbi:helix-turn-helix domain-containing protein [Breznakiellaceae bacterium SP9]
MEPLKEFLSANIKDRREALGISQEKLAELADVSVQMIKRIEGRRSWVGDKMLAKLALALGVSAFQLLVPAKGTGSSGASPLFDGLLRNLRQNIQDDINSRFERLLPTERLQP